MGKWLHYNFAAGNFVANFIRLKLDFIFLKTKKSIFDPPFGDLGATYALHL